MKKLLLWFLALMTLCSCAFSGDDAVKPDTHANVQASFDALATLVQEELAAETLAESVTYDDCDEIAACYGFKAAALRDGYVISSVYALNVLEIGLFYAKSEANTTVIAENLRTYLDGLEQQYAACAPETAALVRSAEILVHENLCVLLLCPSQLQKHLTERIRTEIFLA